MVKVISIYLPQFHETTYNNEWWGEGYTEWTACKNAKPLYKNHYQPRIPLDGYYDLSDVNAINRQAMLAKKYKIDGFAIYHYYSMGSRLLDKPIELLYENKHIDIEYCLYWANHSWVRSWIGHNNDLLWEQKYGSCEDWTKHFYYCLKFFKDKRYIYKEGKPVFIIYNTDAFKDIDNFMLCWNELAKKNGLKGIFFIKTLVSSQISLDVNSFDAILEREPNFTIAYKNDKCKFLRTRIVWGMKNLTNKLLYKMDKGIVSRRIAYDEVVKSSVQRKAICDSDIPSVFPGFDSSPRHDYRGLIIDGSTPEKFKEYFRKQYKKAVESKLEMIFINAWNEWGEGAYIEPDTVYKYQYLEAIKGVVAEYEN